MRKTCTMPVWISFLLFLNSSVFGETPRWIWHGAKSDAIQPGDKCFLRKTFYVETKPDKALLSIVAGDEAILYINGHYVAHAKGYTNVTSEEVTNDIKSGENVIAIQAKSGKADQAGVLALLDLKLKKN